MKIHSPIGDFVEVLWQIRQNALINQTKFSNSEASTRNALIDPLLRALGWDTSNPNMVEVEKTIPPTSRVDYALMDSQNKIQVIIEAKALSGNLSDNRIILNLIMYAFSSGVKDIFLTNGMIWEHYTDYVPGNTGSSKTLNFLDGNLFDCASYLIQELDAAKFWPDDKSEIPPSDQLSQQVLALRNEISSIRTLLSSMQKPTEVEKSTEKNQNASTKVDSTLVNISDLLGHIRHGMEPPVALRLPDGDIVPIKTWRDILIQSSIFVLKNNPSIPIPFFDKAGKSVYLLDFKPPRERIGNYPFEINGRMIYIYTHYDLINCVKNSLHILSQLPKDSIKFPLAVKFKQESPT